MSLTLLPAVDVRDGKAVRLRQGESGSETDYGSPLEAARTWVESGAEWIHLVDLDAAFGTGNNRDQLRAIVKELGLSIMSMVSTVHETEPATRFSVLRVNTDDIRELCRVLRGAGYRVTTKYEEQ